MPVYEYRCTACEHEFEVLERSHRVQSPPACPVCSNGEVVRKLSVFQAREGDARASGTSGHAGCPRCGDPDGPCSI